MKIKLVGTALVASLALAACGGSTSSSLNGYVASLGGSSNLQVTLTAQATGPGSAQASAILKVVSLGMNFSNPDGNSISSASDKANTEITVSARGKKIIAIRNVNSNLYFNVDVNSLGSIPGVKLPAAQLSAFELLFGGRWFELPQKVLNSLVPPKMAKSTKASKDQAVATEVINRITNIINNAKVTDLGHGKYSETGTLRSIAEAVQAGVKSVGKISSNSTKGVKGTYVLTLSTSGSDATGASIKIISPKADKSTATLNATFAHANYVVAAPAGAKVLSSSMLAALFAGAQG